MYPYFKNPQTWNHKQIKPFDTQRATPVLLEAGKAMGKKEYIQLANQLGVQGKSFLLMPYYDLMK